MARGVKGTPRQHQHIVRLGETEEELLTSLCERVRERYPAFDLSESDVIRFLIVEANKSWGRQAKGEMTNG